MENIQRYEHSGPGYNPFLIRPGWQFALLNYQDGLGVEDAIKLERHEKTDEVFFLFAGEAVLLAAGDGVGNGDLEIHHMQTGVAYNVPRGIWHWIVMAPNARVAIVENDGTHLGDVQYRDMCDEQLCACGRIEFSDSFYRGKALAISQM